MNRRPCDVNDDASAYVLGGIEPRARVTFEAHLAQCEECAADVRSLRHVGAALAQTVPQPPLPPELRRHLLDSLTEPRRRTVDAGRRRWPA
jgi:anti-sigma factor RsiW